jgi:uncharacterized protein YndB with AHSA1/START domain
MRMGACAVLMAWWISAAQAQGDALGTIGRFLAARLPAARYMEQRCAPEPVPGWEGFPTLGCEYAVKDRSGMVKSARVVMLNPTPDQLARWIVSACREVQGDARLDSCADGLARHILTQSGGQFPVAGVVYEDISPRDGIHEAYAFRDGVAVEVEGLAPRAVHSLSAAELTASMEGRVLRTRPCARLQSTTREHYRAAGGAQDVEELAWLAVSRKTYQAAWTSDRNALMVAWLKAQGGQRK